MADIKKQNGYIILLSVMLIGAVSVTIAVSLLAMGIGSGQSSLSLQRSKQAKAMAQSCMDEALYNIYQNNSYTGTASTTIAGLTCNFTVTNTGGSNRRVDAWSNIYGVVQKTRVELDSVSPINITSWQEMAEL